MTAATHSLDLNQASTRRDVLRTGCGCAAMMAKALTAAAAAPRLFDGCLITSEGYQQYRTQGEAVYPLTEGLIARNRYWHTSGDPAVDRDLDRALGVVADLFVVNPAFGFYDPSKLDNPAGFEREGMNAFASGENTDITGTRGTVAFGWDLFRQEFYQHDSTGLTVMAIAAHEFGHILQMNRGHLPAIRIGYPLKSEINADFLSGYFLGVRKRRIPSLRFYNAGDMFVRFGRGNDGNPTRTHGTAQERLDAAEAGFRVAYVENKSLDDAVRAGLEYIGFYILRRSIIVGAPNRQGVDFMAKWSVATALLISAVFLCSNLASAQQQGCRFLLDNCEPQSKPQPPQLPPAPAPPTRTETRDPCYPIFLLPSLLPRGDIGGRSGAARKVQN